MDPQSLRGSPTCCMPETGLPVLQGSSAHQVTALPSLMPIQYQICVPRAGQGGVSGAFWPSHSAQISAPELQCVGGLHHSCFCSPCLLGLKWCLPQVMGHMVNSWCTIRNGQQTDGRGDSVSQTHRTQTTIVHSAGPPWDAEPSSCSRNAGEGEQ